MRFLKLTIVSIFAFVIAISASISLILETPIQRYHQTSIAAPVLAADSNSAIAAIAIERTLSSIVNVRNFSIRIPKIAVRSRVIPEVDPRYQSVYGPVIEKYVAHGKFTRLPFEAVNDGNVYLFAHRNGESGIFNRLGELRTGDKIRLKFNSKIYIYQVKNSFIVDPKNTKVYTSFADSPTLTLQTCENGESQRLIVKSKLVKVI